jgi:apolipoprotein N-acyltransferase
MLILLWPLLSVVLLALSFTFYHLGWLVLVAFVPLFEFIRRSHKQGWSIKKTTFYLVLSGLLFYAYNLVWVLKIRPELWAKVNGHVIPLLLILVWLVSILMYSSGFVLFSLITSKLKDRKLFSLRYLWLLPALWIVTEYLRGWFVSLVSWGPGASLGPNYNFGALGFGLSGSPLVFLGRFFGLYGLSGLIILINLLIYRAINKRYKLAIPISGVILALSIVAAFIFNDPGRALKVGLVQTQTVNQNYHEQLLNLAQNQLAAKDLPLDILVTPEGSNYYKPASTDTVKQINKALFKNDRGLIVSGGELNSTSGTPTLDIVYRQPNGQEVSRQQKSFLIAAGEYVPFVVKSLLQITGHRDMLAVYQAQRTVQKSSNLEEPVQYQDTAIGTLACSGVISPGYYKRLSQHGAEVLVNSAELDIMQYSPTYFSQAKQMIVFQAVANAKPLVQASNSGYSYAVTSQGKIDLESKNRQLGLYPVKVQASKAKTFYSRFGEVWVPISCIAILAVSILGYRKRRR